MVSVTAVCRPEEGLSLRGTRSLARATRRPRFSGSPRGRETRDCRHAAPRRARVRYSFGGHGHLTARSLARGGSLGLGWHAAAMTTRAQHTPAVVPPCWHAPAYTRVHIS